MIAMWESDISDTFLIPPLNCQRFLIPGASYSILKMAKIGQYAWAIAQEKWSV